MTPPAQKWPSALRWCVAAALAAHVCAGHADAQGPEAKADSDTDTESDFGTGTGTGSGVGTGTGTGTASESESESESGSVSESDSGSESESDSVSESASESAPAPFEDPAAKAAIALWAAEQRTAALEQQLQRARERERNAGSWVPWAMAGTGVAALTAGLLIGAIPTAACDDSCPQPFWPSWLLMGGAALTTAGTLWLVILDRDESELRYRRKRIEQQLEYERWNRQPAPRGASLTLSGRM